MKTLELVLVLATALTAVLWYLRVTREPAPSGTRVPVLPREIGIATAVATGCLAANALAVWAVTPLSRTNLGPLALAYHERQPSPFLLATALLLLLLASIVPRLGRAALVVFAGAATANVVSPLLWNGAVPDYLVLHRIDVIANLSDASMVVTGAIAVVSLFTLGPRQQPTTPTTAD